ncbi:D-alanyl-D-alanine carboxypeptidase family protein [Candidatus Dependentiae bacterium]|nr:D-alanyl-D-alanine carboxypeptidase family protein [Candidatus Dependentiae bacterium]
MKKILFTILFPLTMLANNWNQLLEQYRNIMGESTYQLIYKQYQDFVLGKAPAIADQCIKQIPIVECGQELVDLRAVNHTRIKVMEDGDLIKAHTYSEDIDPRCTKHAMIRRGVFEALERMIDKLDELASEFGYEKGDLEIKLFEGLRDLTTQKQLFDSKMKIILQENPDMTEQEAYTETSKWVSPYINNVPVHSTGAAIDIHLWSRKAQSFCDMGRFNVGGNLAPMFSEDATLSDKQKTNRLLFLIAATKAGLTNYLYEFWHFSYGDRYAFYWRESNPDLKIAIYGPA